MINITVDGKPVKLYTPLDAQDYCGISDQTLNKWRREGWLQGHPVGRGYLYTQQGLDDALRSRNYVREDSHDQPKH